MQFANPKLVLRKVFDDPTPNGIVANRIIKSFLGLADSSEMTSEKRDVYCRILLLFGKKLVAVWSHLKTYKEIEVKLIEQVRNKPPVQGDVVTIEHSQDLFLEFDEFLVQIKSSLDYLAKIPVPILAVC